MFYSGGKDAKATPRRVIYTILCCLLLGFPQRAYAEDLMMMQQDQGGEQSEAAQILMGWAAIFAAMAPIAVAGAQAGAEKAVARIQADAQIQMTVISADTSKYIANQNTGISLEQTAAAERINLLNQNGVTQRLDMQLAELRDAREDAAERERSRLVEEKRLNTERVALAQKQADDNLKLARLSLNAQLTQAGLTSGFGSSRNSSNALTSTTLAGNVAANSLANTGTGQAAKASAKTVGALAAIESTKQSGGLGVLLSDSTSFPSGKVAPPKKVETTTETRVDPASPASPVVRAAMPSPTRLLSSLSGPAPSASDAEQTAPDFAPAALSAPEVVPGSLTAPERRTTKPMVVTANQVRALSFVLNSAAHRSIRGSSRALRVGIKEEAKPAPSPIVRAVQPELTRIAEAVSGHGSTHQ